MNRLSNYATFSRFAGLTVVSHAVSAARISLPGPVAERLHAFAGREFTDDEFVRAGDPGSGTASVRAGEPGNGDACVRAGEPGNGDACVRAGEPRGGAEFGRDDERAGLLRLLRSRHLVVDADEDERGRWELFLRDGLPEAGPYDRSTFWSARPLDAPTLARLGRTDSGAVRPVRVVGLGGCVLDFARDELLHEGYARGLDISFETVWPDSTARLRSVEADLVILQLGIFPHLTRLWDAAPAQDPAQRRVALTRIKKLFTRWVTALTESLPDSGLAVVHNVAPSALSPYGRFEHAVDLNTREVLAELNGHVDELLRADPRLLLLDEERLVARHGALTLFDDHLVPFGHHGGDQDPRIEIANQRPALGRVLAAEYLDLYEAATRQGEIKCVVTDLDGTLWPGIAADDGFGWTDSDSTSSWVHFGLHQTLRLLKSRGLLLATCSKGTERYTLDAWRAAEHPMLLGPDDFVTHRINWSRKSANVADIAAELGFAPGALLFLDDNPVERWEVARALPDVRILDGEPHTFRRQLLDSPLLDRPPAGAEARNRSETTRAMLARGSVEAADPVEFIRELDVEVEVREAVAADLPRLAELFNRTNQYTTTAWRPGARELEALLGGPDGALFVCRVRDRFADYGLTGVLALTGDDVTCLAVSCRVIGLDIGPVFLAAALHRSGRARPGVGGRFVPTGRNAAAGDVFLRAGLRPGPDGRFALVEEGDLVGTDAFPHRLVRP
ncbi:HAD-IIIC family phosphatase [Kitasatospora sp. NPDC101447]|uniref:HAD-IIIC family phosphatase n=1 Tax=Kitasatospora sp. NPDC101447 TaxID=3364102 RepID=UPI00382F9993